MKNYGDVKFPKGFVGYASENGHGNWWYPNRQDEMIMPINFTARHLHLWKNQGDYAVFAVPMCVFKPDELFNDKGRKQYVAIWFLVEDLDELANTETV